MPLKKTVLLSAFVVFCCFAPLYSQTIESIILTEPANGEIAAGKPMFRIIVKGEDIPRNARYKIELSDDNFKTILKTFEQLNDRKGWAFNEVFDSEDYSVVLERGATYRVQEPLPEGEYQWRASVYDGTIYHDGDDVSSFIVDSTPPAEVTGLTLQFDSQTGFTSLRWDPIFLNVNGGSEYIDHYNVYRYERRSFFFVIRPFYIGSTEKESFVDKDVNKNSQGKVLFYKVVGVDKAGNELGRRY